MSVKKIILQGVFYTGIAKYSNIVVSIIIGAILARLLSPEEFGVVAIVTVFVTFFQLLSDFGIGPAIVQNQNLNKNDVKSLFTVMILVGFTMSLLFFLSADIIAEFYDNIELIKITQLLSISVFFYSVQVVPLALIQKELKFRELGVISFSVQTFTGIIAVFLAFKDFSYYSLIIKSIIESSVLFLIYLSITKPGFTIRISITSIKKVFRFSIYQFLFNFINYFSRNSDNILIGKYLSSSSLGYYDKSYRLMLLPVQNLTHVITPVLMPVLSKYGDDKERVLISYLKVVRILALIGFPLSIFLFFNANEVILILYGDQWKESVIVFRYLALSIGIQMVLSSTGAIFQSLNRTDLLFFSGVLSSIMMVSGILYGILVTNSLSGVAVGLLVAFIINFFQGFYFLIKKLLAKK